MVLLRMLGWLLDHAEFEFSVVLHHDGPLRTEIERLAPTTVLDPFHGSSRTAARILRRLAPRETLERVLAGPIGKRIKASNFDLAWINSLASWRAAELIVPPEIPRVLHVHELEYAIERVGPAAGSSCWSASAFVAASGAVRDNLIRRHGVDPERITVVYSSIPKRANPPLSVEQTRSGRKRLGVSDGDLLLIGCGFASERKGVDLLPELMRLLRVERGLKAARFAWIGLISDEFEAQIQDACDRRGVSGAIEFIGEVDDPGAVMALGDVFVLPSREEPLGLVCLEAAQCGLPTVCFTDAGGATEFVGQDAGRSVDLLESSAMAEAIVELAGSRELRARLAACGRSKIDAVFNLDRQGPILADLLTRVAGRA